MRRTREGTAETKRMVKLKIKEVMAKKGTETMQNIRSRLRKLF